LPALLTYVPFVHVGAAGGTYVPTVVTCVTGAVVTTSLCSTLLASVPSEYVTRYVFVSTPSAPTVVTDEVPSGSVALCTVVDGNGTGLVSVTSFVVITGVGFDEIRVCFGARVGEEVAATDIPVGAVAVGCAAPYAAPDPRRNATAMPIPRAAAARFRGRRSQVRRLKISP